MKDGLTLIISLGTVAVVLGLCFIGYLSITDQLSWGKEAADNMARDYLIFNTSSVIPPTITLTDYHSSETCLGGWFHYLTYTYNTTDGKTHNADITIGEPDHNNGDPKVDNGHVHHMFVWKVNVDGEEIKS